MEIDGFGLHETALRFRARRNQLLSSNIANADTPNYKARDIEFSTALKNAQQGGIGVERTSDLHIKSWGTARDGGEAMYRIPVQSALDGNTVETDVEQAAFAENALKYRASLAFLDGKLRTLRLAIKGGE
ncbi:MAG: flagellar basal body rod protein FlgB [Woeseiaceae bacterium]|nr:flagellar basal body rod protein FlgB [Woeseiaceae bacterium]